MSGWLLFFGLLLVLAGVIVWVVWRSPVGEPVEKRPGEYVVIERLEFALTEAEFEEFLRLPRADQQRIERELLDAAMRDK